MAALQSRLSYVACWMARSHCHPWKYHVNHLAVALWHHILPDILLNTDSDMACHLLCAKPLPEPILTYWNLEAEEQTTAKFEYNFFFYILIEIWIQHTCISTSFQENAVKNVFNIMAAILIRPQSVRRYIEINYLRTQNIFWWINDA